MYYLSGLLMNYIFSARDPWRVAYIQEIIIERVPISAIK